MTETAHPEGWDTLADTGRGGPWHWRDGQLVHAAATDRPRESPDAGWKSRVRWLVVRNVYATHNKSRTVREALDRVLRRLDGGGWGLNLGAGFTRIHPRMVTIDVMNAANIDIVTDGSVLPLRENSLELVVAQEVLEHIADFQGTIDEVHRALRAGGVFYCQVPFQIGKHHGPMDYWRFSRDALEHLFENEDWSIEEMRISLGHGTGFYRIAVEYGAVTASCLWSRLYLPAKTFFALALIPFRWLDVLTLRSPEADRIAAGYLVVARKRGADPTA
ncbi:MAG: methyltransferase domain-containing protein [Paracoccaceae bacterium]